ncbi:MAG: hypothetical protein B7X32_04895 [Microbacterium sp. 13-71-7]|nr:MAG: hypothetical protein B7X32_04895 [Microbacterium sp. 13-71-7]
MVNKVQVRVHEMTGLMPVSLADQVSGGDTVIEKFERYAADSSVALILLTPDDFGGVAGETSQPRARQNVVFEFGYFVAKLGRKKVIALNDGVELPSDLAGVVYVSLHTTNWMTTLRKELRAAGVPIID